MKNNIVDNFTIDKKIKLYKGGTRRFGLNM